jgi:hypothetical protein
MCKLTWLQNNLAHNILIPVVDEDGAFPTYHIRGVAIDSQPELRADHAGHSYGRPHAKVSGRSNNLYHRCQ